MEKLCRACGSELEVVELCEGCGEPIRKKCNACLRETDSTHVHRELLPYILAD